MVVMCSSVLLKKNFAISSSSKDWSSIFIFPAPTFFYFKLRGKLHRVPLPHLHLDSPTANVLPLFLSLLQQVPFKKEDILCTATLVFHVGNLPRHHHLMSGLRLQSGLLCHCQVSVPGLIFSHNMGILLKSLGQLFWRISLNLDLFGLCFLVTRFRLNHELHLKVGHFEAKCPLYMCCAWPRPFWFWRHYWMRWKR